MVGSQFCLLVFLVLTIIVSLYSLSISMRINGDISRIYRNLGEYRSKFFTVNDSLKYLQLESSIIALSNAQKLSFKRISFGDNVYEIVICIDDESQVIYNSNDGLTYLDNFNANNAKKIKLVLDNMGLVNILFTKNLLPVA